ncbi:hypothetical protein P8452_69015 [Trifolium repens]|nr:hypothetical protein P8452_69015 [Trifolium repens]
MQRNELHRKVSLYLHSLPSLEDSDFTNLISNNQNDIVLSLDSNQTIEDRFLGATLFWFNQKTEPNRTGSFVLKIRKTDKRRILNSYLRHIHDFSDEVASKRKRDLRLFVNVTGGGYGGDCGGECGMSYLGVKDHKLFPKVEEIFRHGASLSPAEIGELMIANRNSPSRAIKSVIGALQMDGDGRGVGDMIVRRIESDESDGYSNVKDLRKLYGLFRLRNVKRNHASNFDQ